MISGSSDVENMGARSDVHRFSQYLVVKLRIAPGHDVGSVVFENMCPGFASETAAQISVSYQAADRLAQAGNVSGFDQKARPAIGDH